MIKEGWCVKISDEQGTYVQKDLKSTAFAREKYAVCQMHFGAADAATAAYAFKTDARRHSRIKLKGHLRIGSFKSATR